MRQVIDTLREQRNGRLVDEMTVKFAKLIRSVRSTGKVGSMQVTLKLKPRQGSEDQIEIEDTVKLTVPEPVKSTTVFLRTKMSCCVKTPISATSTAWKSLKPKPKPRRLNHHERLQRRARKRI